LEPGGLFRNLRTDPVAAAMARDAKKLCPKAPILSYTNPQSSSVLAVKTVAPDVQWMGLCHELFGGMGTIKRALKKYSNIHVKKWEEFDIEYTGVNHFTWLTSLKLKDEDLYPIIRKNAHDMVLKNFAHHGFNFHLCEKYGYFSIPGGRHVAEFLPDYYNYFNHEIQCPYWHFPKIRNVSIIRTQRKAVMSLVFMGQHGIIVPKPRHSPEKAIDMCLDWHSSLTGENNTNHVVNIYNNGTVPELPSDSIIEIPAYFKNGVITPKKTIHLDRQIADMVKPHCEEQRLIVNAALGNDIKLIIKAMLNDPMNKWIEEDDRIEYMTKLMLYYEQQWLPEQWKEWIPTEKELKESKWYVSPKELAKSGGAYLKKKFPVDEKLKQKAFFWKD
jgi:alpha-galactosidase